MRLLVSYRHFMDLTNTNSVLQRTKNQQHHRRHSEDCLPEPHRERSEVGDGACRDDEKSAVGA
jgi:hypothetical protein